MVEVLVKLAEVKCPNCGVIFWLEEEYKKHRQNDHRAVYCPNGHNLYYPEQTEEERLRGLLLSRERDYRQATKERDKYKKQVTQLEKRVRAGVCPHCHRHFENLERHMMTKHAEDS